MDQIRTRKQLQEWLDIEMTKYGKRGRLDFLQLSEKAILRKHQNLLRKTEYFTNTGKKIRAKWYLFQLRKIQLKYSIHIPLNCCNLGLKIMHVGPILINGNAIVGKNCVFHINTSLVASGTSDDAPVLEEGVIVGIGAVVMGGIHIAKHIAIGANSVVNKSFEEENIAIAGVPARKVSNNGSLEWNKRGN